MHIDTQAYGLTTGVGKSLLAWLERRRTRRRNVALQGVLGSLDDHTLRDIGFIREPIAASIWKYGRHSAAHHDWPQSRQH